MAQKFVPYIQLYRSFESIQYLKTNENQQLTKLFVEITCIDSIDSCFLTSRK